MATLVGGASPSKATEELLETMQDNVVSGGMVVTLDASLCGMHDLVFVLAGNGVAMGRGRKEGCIELPLLN